MASTYLVGDVCKHMKLNQAGLISWWRMEMIKVTFLSESLIELPYHQVKEGVPIIWGIHFMLWRRAGLDPQFPESVWLVDVVQIFSSAQIITGLAKWENSAASRLMLSSLGLFIAPLATKALTPRDWRHTMTGSSVKGFSRHPDDGRDHLTPPINSSAVYMLLQMSF